MNHVNYMNYVSMPPCLLSICLCVSVYVVEKQIKTDHKLAGPFYIYDGIGKLRVVLGGSGRKRIMHNLAVWKVFLEMM